MALDLVTGATTWQVAPGGTVIAPLTIADGTVLATPAEGVLHALDLATRKEIWPFAGAADGAQASVHAGTVYLGTRQHKFVALDATTGTCRWAVRMGSSANKNAIFGDVAYVGGDGGSTLTAINLISRKILCSFDTHSDRIATPAVAGGTVFVAGVAAAGLTGRNTSLFALDARRENYSGGSHRQATRRWPHSPWARRTCSSVSTRRRASSTRSTGRRDESTGR